jgi:hypothetical protein
MAVFCARFMSLALVLEIMTQGSAGDANTPEAFSPLKAPARDRSMLTCWRFGASVAARLSLYRMRRDN